MPVGSLPAFNLLGVEEAQRREEAEEKKKASERSGLSSQMWGLWEQASGKKQDRREKGGGGLMPQAGNSWDFATGKKREKQAKDNKDSFRLFGGNTKKQSSIDWGPGGALGIGCGVGIGVGLTGIILIIALNSTQTLT